MMRFASPWAFALLILIPLAIWALTRPRRTAALQFPGAADAASLPRTLRARLSGLVPPTLRLAALTLLVVAIARPQHGIGHTTTSTDAVAIELVVDRSGSMREPMLYAGEAFTKIDVVKRVLSEFVLGDTQRGLEGRPADLIGLVTFAGIAETVCPVVQDPKAVVELANAVRLAPGQGPEAGTAIGDGLALAAARLKNLDESAAHTGADTPDAPLRIKSKVIILLTDGQNTGGIAQPLDAAAQAAEWGIKVHTIGIGGGPMPPAAGPQGFGDLIRMAGGEFDEPTLKRIAEKTGGIYRRATDAESLRKVYAEIDAMEKTTVQTTTYTDYNERFTPFAAAGGSLLLLELLLGCTLFRRLP